MPKLCPINAWITSLDGSINDSVTSLTLLAAIPTANSPTAGDYVWVFIGGEVIRLTIPSPASGKTFVAARARDGSTAAAHDDETPVIVALTREALTQFRDDAVAVAVALSQPLDATLTALAGNNWSANSIAIGSGSDTVAQVTFAANTFAARASTGNLDAKSITNFGLDLVDSADADAARTTLGLGTVSTLDFDDDPALPTDDDDHVPTVAAVREYIDDAIDAHGTGIDTSAVTDGQLLIGRTSDHTINFATLTAGYMSSITNGASSITLALASPLTVDTDGATVTFDLALSNTHQVTLGGNRTLALSNAGSGGKKFVVSLIEDATGGRTVTWWSGITWKTLDGSAPTLITTANAVNIYGFLCTGSGTYIGWDMTPESLDATLTAFAALTIAANSLTIGTGADAFSQTTFAANTFPGRASTGDLVAKPITDLSFTFLALSTAVTQHDATHVQGADIGSATTTDLNAATGDFIFITGTTTITGLGTAAAGVSRTVKFTGALTLTHNATSLQLPGAANITTADGDTAHFRSLGSGNWKCIFYNRVSAGPAFTTAIHDFSSSGTVPIPVGATKMEVIVIGGGGGGGSGRRGGAATNRLGGSAGSGGCMTTSHISVADLGGEGTGLTVTVGTGGAGGAAVSADDTNGNAGSDGVDSSITRTSDGEVIAYASRGQGGAGGIESASTSAVTGVTSSAMFNGGTGGGSRPDATATAGSNNGPASAGGGGGGGLSSAATARAGGNGGAGGRAWRGASTNAAGGAATGANGADAGTPTFVAVPGGGGGGGGAGTGVGGTGGAGKRGGGGGGGAASVNSNNSGAGGAGGDGYIRIIFS